MSRVLDWTNDQLSRMTGYTAEELRGKSARIFYADDEEFDRVGRHKYADIRSKGTGSIVTVWRRKDGRTDQRVPELDPHRPRRSLGRRRLHGPGHHGEKEGPGRALEERGEIPGPFRKRRHGHFPEHAGGPVHHRQPRNGKDVRLRLPGGDGSRRHRYRHPALRRPRTEGSVHPGNRRTGLRQEFRAPDLPQGRKRLLGLRQRTGGKGQAGENHALRGDPRGHPVAQGSRGGPAGKRRALLKGLPLQPRTGCRLHDRRGSFHRGQRPVPRGLRLWPGRDHRPDLRGTWALERENQPKGRDPQTPRDRLRREMC